MRLVQSGVNLWELSINGQKHGSNFKSVKDFAEWLGNMNEHGLYKGANAVSETLCGHESKIEPTYEHPCHVPEGIW